MVLTCQLRNVYQKNLKERSGQFFKGYKIYLSAIKKRLHFASQTTSELKLDLNKKQIYVQLFKIWRLS